jgi:hypothetical protein
LNTDGTKAEDFKGPAPLKAFASLLASSAARQSSDPDPDWLPTKSMLGCSTLNSAARVEDLFE